MVRSIRAIAAAGALVLALGAPAGATTPPGQETVATDLFAELTSTGYVLYGRLVSTSTCAGVRFTQIPAPSPFPLPLPRPPVTTRAIAYRAEQFVTVRRMLCVAKKQLIPVFMTVQDGKPRSLIVVSTNFPHGVIVPVQPLL